MAEQEPDRQQDRELRQAQEQRRVELERLLGALEPLKGLQRLKRLREALWIEIQERPGWRERLRVWLRWRRARPEGLSAQGLAAPLSLYFDLDNFAPTDIVDIIGLLSELYTDLGGDVLIIDDVTLLDFQPTLVPVEE